MPKEMKDLVPALVFFMAKLENATARLGISTTRQAMLLHFLYMLMSDLKLDFVTFTGLRDCLVGHTSPPLCRLPMFCTPTHCISKESPT